MPPLVPPASHLESSRDDETRLSEAESSWARKLLDCQIMTIATCFNCHSMSDMRNGLEACPNCGLANWIANAMSVGPIEILPSVDLKVKNPSYKGRHKYARETKSVAEHSEDGRLVRVTQTIDRRNDRYRKMVKDVNTGEILREADHPLSEHTGHGSDKPVRTRD